MGIDMSKIEPNVGKCLVQLDQESGKTSGGIIIPQSAEVSGVKQGVVTAVGPTRLVEGNPTGLILAVGDRVLLDPFGGTKIKVNGVEQILLRVEDVVGRVVA
jgi:chaperonin GroES